MEVPDDEIRALKTAWDRACDDDSFDAVKAWPGDLYDAIEAVTAHAPPE